MLSMCACTFFEREKSVNIGPGMARDDSLLGIAANTGCSKSRCHKWNPEKYAQFQAENI